MPSVISRFKAFVGRLKKDRVPHPASGSENLDKRLVFSLSDKRLPNVKQLKHLGRYLSPREKSAMQILTALIAVALLAAGAKFYNDHVSFVPDYGGDYVEAVVGAPHLVNPILTASNDADLDLVSLVFSGLMKTDPKGALVPDLAETYEISPDGKTYTFHLRDGVQWQDGTDFSADDVVATMDYIKDPTWKSPHLAQFKNVTVEAPDDKTVKFTLSEPFAPFLSLLTIGILPEHLWTDIKPENAVRAELNAKPIGTGPFKFKSLIKDKKGAIKSYTLARNEGYYLDRPYLASITFKYYPDYGSATDALLKKKVDGISFLPPEDRGAVDKLGSAKSYVLRLPQYTAVFFNVSKNAALKSKNVRQALALAVDKDKIMREAVPDGAPVYGPMLPGFTDYVNSDVKQYNYDPTAAAALLDKDGWKLDENGARVQETTDKTTKAVTKTPLTLTLTTVDAKENMAVASMIKDEWGAIGVKTELEIEPASKIQSEKIRPRDYDALLYGEILGPDPDPYPFWHSSQDAAPGLNLAVYSNRRVDELLEKARVTNSDAERVADYKEFQSILAEEVPAIFLYSPTYTYVVSRKIKNLDTATIFSPSDRFVNVDKWYIDTRRAWHWKAQ